LVIAADTSSLIAYLSGLPGNDALAVDAAILGGSLRLPPAVVTELLSDSKSRNAMVTTIAAAPKLAILPGYWERAGGLRARILSKGLKAKIPGCLIAQSCLDHDVPLITRDPDFRHFEKHCGLKLV
jgi:predicted nucleic acid-binding protein